MKSLGFNFSTRSSPIRPEDIVRTHPAGEAIVVQASGGTINHSADFEQAFRDDKEKIDIYRKIADTTYVDAAIDDISDEAIDLDQYTGKVVRLDTSRSNFSSKIRKTIEKEFEGVLDIMNFGNRAQELFRSWYVDGRQMHFIIPGGKKGIKEVRWLDSRYVKKIRKVSFDQTRTFEENLRIPKIENSFIFVVPDIDDHDLSWIGGYASFNTSANAIELTEESIAYVDSGLFGSDGQIVSHLQKALKPHNQLSMMEDAAVIQKLVRAPQRRLWYIDVGNLQKGTAEAYIQNLIKRHRNKMTYNVNTGGMDESYDVQNMLEDIWLPRSEGGKTTEVQTLDGQADWSNMDEIMHFKQKLYKAMKIPLSRLQQESSFGMGRTTEISRDEAKFSKFIGRLCDKFGQVLIEVLKRQLILKRIITAEEWIENRDRVNVQFSRNSYFSELKNMELMTERLNLLEKVDPFVGKYFTKKFVEEHVLNRTEIEIEENDEQMDMEREAEEIPSKETVDARLFEDDPEEFKSVPGADTGAEVPGEVDESGDNFGDFYDDDNEQEQSNETRIIT
jgi:hypothetical protein